MQDTHDRETALPHLVEDGMTLMLAAKIAGADVRDPAAERGLLGQGQESLLEGQQVGIRPRFAEALIGEEIDFAEVVVRLLL
jgi:hypothetical protein